MQCLPFTPKIADTDNGNPQFLFKKMKCFMILHAAQLTNAEKSTNNN
jgi:hypothetical protein